MKITDPAHKIYSGLVPALCISLTTTFAQSITSDPFLGAAPTTASGLLLNVNSNPTGEWIINTNYVQYSGASDQLASATSQDFRGAFISQIVDTSAMDTVDGYRLEIEYSANNVADIGLRAASIFYKVIGINNPATLTDETLSVRISSTGDPSQALASAFEATEISPNGTALLSGYIDISNASNVIDELSEIEFTINANYDMLVVAIGSYGIDSDNVGESLSFSRLGLFESDAISPHRRQAMILEAASRALRR